MVITLSFHLCAPDDDGVIESPHCVGKIHKSFFRPFFQERFIIYTVECRNRDCNELLCYVESYKKGG